MEIATETSIRTEITAHINREWQSLVDLRPHLTSFDRADVDETLRRMAREQILILAPESNRKALTDLDHQAAVAQGGERKHLVVMR